MKIFKMSLYLIFIITPIMVNAQPATTSFIQGQDYVRIPEGIRNNPDVQQLVLSNPNKVQVLFFFSYGCPACARFDPYFEKWVKTININTVIYRIPVSFKEEWLSLAKLYYMTQYLKPKDNIDEKIFEAIHNKDMRLWLQPEMVKFLIENGYTASEVDDAYNSFNVNI